MNYRECLDDIVKIIIEQKRISLYYKFKDSPKHIFDKRADLINYLISRNLLRFGYNKSSDYTSFVTWTRLGNNKLMNKSARAKILDEFREAFEIGNEE